MNTKTFFARGFFATAGEPGSAAARGDAQHEPSLSDGSGCGSTWCLQRSQALRLPVSRTARWLRLRDGALWVTAEGRSDAPPPEDWWLQPGQSLRVPAGTPLLAQAWPSASFELLEEPRA